MRVTTTFALVAASVLLTAASAAADSTVKLSAGYTDNTVQVAYRFWKAVIRTRDMKHVKRPQGGELLLIYATAQDFGKRSVSYNFRRFTAFSSLDELPLKSVTTRPEYSPQIGHGALRPGEKRSGWLGYAVPASVSTVDVRLNLPNLPNDNPVLFSVRVR